MYGVEQGDGRAKGRLERGKEHAHDMDYAELLMHQRRPRRDFFLGRAPAFSGPPPRQRCFLIIRINDSTPALNRLVACLSSSLRAVT